MTTGREGSTDLVTLCEVPCVAPEINRETGEMENSSSEVSPGHSENFAESSLQDAEVLSGLFYWKTSFRTSCDTTSTGRGKSEKTEESGSLLVAIFYVFVRYLVKPLNCDYAVYVIVSTSIYVHYVSVFVILLCIRQVSGSTPALCL